jgi:N-acyl homoserine lactone hydrolase
VLEHLAALNLRPQDIDILICTHFDVDHTGYHDHFSFVQLIVQREHYMLARNGHPRFAAARGIGIIPPSVIASSTATQNSFPA